MVVYLYTYSAHSQHPCIRSTVLIRWHVAWEDAIMSNSGAVAQGKLVPKAILPLPDPCTTLLIFVPFSWISSIVVKVLCKSRVLGFLFHALWKSGGWRGGHIKVNQCKKCSWTYPYLVIKEKNTKSKKEMQRTANIYFVTVYKWRATSVIYNFHSNAH